MGCMPGRGHTGLTDANEGAAVLMVWTVCCFEFDGVNYEQAVVCFLHSAAARQRSCNRSAVEAVEAVEGLAMRSWGRKLICRGQETRAQCWNEWICNSFASLQR